MMKPIQNRSRLLAWALLACVLAANTGCGEPDVAWLPDSSGFLYISSKGELVRFDVATGKRQVLVADTKTKTILPTVSPDGKRVAFARLWYVRKTNSEVFQVVVYDLDGKELHRSPAIVRGPAVSYNDERPEGYVSVFWGPKGQDQKLLIEEHYGAGGGA